MPRGSREDGTPQSRRGVKRTGITTQESGQPTAPARCAYVALCLWAAAHFEEVLERHLSAHIVRGKL